MNELDRIRSYYASLSDEGLADAMAAGPEAYRTPEIWEVLTREAARRRESSIAAPEVRLNATPGGDADQPLPTAGPPRARSMPSCNPRLLGLEVGIAVLVAGAGAIPAAIAGREQLNPAFELLTVILRDAGLAALFLYLIWRRTGTLESAGLWPGRWSTEILWAVPLALAGVAATWIGIFFSDLLGLPRWNGYDALPFQTLWPIFLLGGALMEEALFRAYLIPAVTQLLGSAPQAVLLSTALFVGMHLPPSGAFMSHLLFGLFYGWAFLVWRRLPRLVIGHWASNLILTYARF